MKLPTFNLKGTFDLNMPASELWDVITNTERVNREVGLPSAKFTPVEIGLKAEGRFFGMPFYWKERPFEWVRGQVFQVDRLFDTTPVKRALGGTRIEAIGKNQTRVTLFAEVEPRDLLGILAAPAVFYFKTIRDLKRIYQKVAKNYYQRTPELFPTSEKPKVNLKRLEQGISKLRQTTVPLELIQKLENHLRTAMDDDVVKMRPYVLAERWQLPRPQVVRLFLNATRAGLLDMEWSVLCPNCRISKANYTNLSELAKTAHCETCNIEYDVNFDQYVELRFTVNPQVREAIAMQFCIAGPFMTRHVLAQLRLLPGQRQEFKLPLEPGSYRLRTRPENGRVTVIALDPTSESNRLSDQPAKISFNADGASEEQVKVNAANASFSVVNETDKELLLMLEQGAWGQQGLTAAEVTTLQEFRDLFSSEVLSAGLGIEIRSLVFLFSDLKDSTAMYERTGDSPAYALVRDHFVIFGDAIVKHQGALVKTIGDAVMAVFSSPEEAMKACLEVQRQIADLNAARPDREPLIVKLGLHVGPCIAINANNIIDYFGSTVNTAARVQGVSVGGDIVITEQVLESSGVAELLEGLTDEPFDIKLKGLSQTFTLHRIWPVPAPKAEPEPETAKAAT